jgi:hypothetical protein
VGGVVSERILVFCPGCGWITHFYSVAGPLSGDERHPVTECKYGCGLVRLATQIEAVWWRDPHKTDTLTERKTKYGEAE